MLKRTSEKLYVYKLNRWWINSKTKPAPKRTRS